MNAFTLLKTTGMIRTSAGRAVGGDEADSSNFRPMPGFEGPDTLVGVESPHWSEI
jgi:hypothetical protein